MRRLSASQYQDLWPVDRGVSTLRRAKQHLWAWRRKETASKERAILEAAFDLCHKLQGERWRDVVLERYLAGQKNVHKLKALTSNRKRGRV